MPGKWCGAAIPLLGAVVLLVGCGAQIPLSTPSGVRTTSSRTQASIHASSSGENSTRAQAVALLKPNDETLPVGITSIQIQLRSVLPPARVVRSLTVTDHLQVAQLVTLVAGLPRDSRGRQHTCPDEASAGTRQLVLNFLTRFGQSVTVTEDTCGDVVFGRPGQYPELTDPGLRLWNASVAMAQEPGWA